MFRRGRGRVLSLGLNAAVELKREMSVLKMSVLEMSVMGKFAAELSGLSSLSGSRFSFGSPVRL
jgi:hypothetical protein